LANEIFKHKKNYYLNINYSATEEKKDKTVTEEKKDKTVTEEKKDKTVSQNRLFSDVNYSSNRFFIWETMLKNYKYEKIFGYGIQADRYDLGLNIRNNNSYNFYNNASNAFLYSFITGGYFGLIFFILINTYILIKIYLFFKKNTFNRHSIYLNTAIVSVLFLMLRNIVENNYAVFSTDMIFFLIYSSIIINDSNKI
jgi:O-antigen ligase